MEQRKGGKQKLKGGWKEGGRERKRARRRIQEIGAHGSGVSKKEGRRFNEGNLKAGFSPQLAGCRV